jgi:Tol biopolymer transport system component
MPLSAGMTLGPYEILAPLGAGGMGEVYRARDTKLKREVALKVLPEAFASDPDRLARVQREAELLATLNHPNIAAIYGVEESAGTFALVMELVEGPTLAELTGRRAEGSGLPLDEALAIARQIADALEAAHERGIVHRDLKPANVKVREDGTVKVLDFGLAKAMDPGSGIRGQGSPGAMNSPTLSIHATQAGVILGTAAYMAPEQTRGKTVDRRADIWAFGVVLYEMLSGRRAFDGDDISITIASVLKDEVGWHRLPADLPASIRRLLRRCLEKDPRRRLSAIGDARLELDEAVLPVDRDAVLAPESVAPPAVPAWRRALPWAVAAVLAIALIAAAAIWAPWRSAPLRAPVRMSAELGADGYLPTRFGSAVALSADGTLLAFVAQKSSGAPSQLYVRRLDQLRATLLSGTEGARDPFFSPDGQSVAFFADGKLKKISISGGAALTLCDAANSRGGTWTANGAIIFQPSSATGASLMRVSAAGGTAEPFLKPADGGTSARWAQVLPGEGAVLYTGNAGGGIVDANVVVYKLPSGPAKVLARGAAYARYVSSGRGGTVGEPDTGHLLYVRDGTLYAAPFSVERLELTGPPVPVIEGVSTSTDTGSAHFTLSASGTLAYVAGPNLGRDVALNWIDRTGTATVLRAAPANWSNPHFSPDGRRLAVDISDGKQLDVWVYDWTRDTASKLTADPADDSKPVWTPDGRRIVFASTRGGGASNLYWQHADGTGEPQRLTESPNAQFASDWHPSGKFLAFQELNPQTGNDLMILPITGDEVSGWKPGKPTVLLRTPANEVEPMFSPDGRWLAYHSNESGRNEVYVRPFPGPGGKWPMSTAGASTPTWSRVRPDLFYRAFDNRLMVASYTVDGDSFRAEKSRLWSERPVGIRPRQRVYDLHPDGERVAAAAENALTQNQDKVVFVFNFFDELRRLAPAAGRR